MTQMKAYTMPIKKITPNFRIIHLPKEIQKSPPILNVLDVMRVLGIGST